VLSRTALIFVLLSRLQILYIYHLLSNLLCSIVIFGIRLSFIAFCFVQVFHPGHASGGNDPVSWTEPYFSPADSYWRHRSDKSWISVDETEAEKHPLPDTQSANAAIEQLKKFSESRSPFFLAVGFHKPHLPFQFPSIFLDQYPVESVKLPNNPFAPANMPEVIILCCNNNNNNNNHISIAL